MIKLIIPTGKKRIEGKENLLLNLAKIGNMPEMVGTRLGAIALKYYEEVKWGRISEADLKAARLICSQPLSSLKFMNTLMKECQYLRLDSQLWKGEGERSE